MTGPESGADIPASESRADIAPQPVAPAPQPQGQYSPDGRWWWNGSQWVAASAAAGAAHAPGTCWICGATPAVQITLRSVVALIIFGITSTKKGVFCRDCGLALFRENMNRTLITGWWGIFHFFINIVAVFGNLSARSQLVKLAAPTRNPGTPFLNPGRTVFLRPGFAVFAVIVVVIGASFAYNSSKASAPFPSADTQIVGTCVQLSSGTYSPTDCSANHAGKVVSLAHTDTGCPSQDTPAKLDDGNYTCIDTTQ